MDQHEIVLRLRDGQRRGFLAATAAAIHELAGKPISECTFRAEEIVDALGYDEEDVADLLARMANANQEKTA